MVDSIKCSASGTPKPAGRLCCDEGEQQFAARRLVLALQGYAVVAERSLDVDIGAPPSSSGKKSTNNGGSSLVHPCRRLVEHLCLIQTGTLDSIIAEAVNHFANAFLDRLHWMPIELPTY